MAHFYGIVKGSAKTLGTRCGSKASGITAKAQGWDVGGWVQCQHGASDDSDLVLLGLSGGSNDRSYCPIVMSFHESGRVILPGSIYYKLGDQGAAFEAELRSNGFAGAYVAAPRSDGGPGGSLVRSASGRRVIID